MLSLVPVNTTSIPGVRKASPSCETPSAPRGSHDHFDLSEPGDVLPMLGRFLAGATPGFGATPALGVGALKEKSDRQAVTVGAAANLLGTAGLVAAIAGAAVNPLLAVGLLVVGGVGYALGTRDEPLY